MSTSGAVAEAEPVVEVEEIQTDLLNAQDRCDQCGAQAFVQVFFEKGDLMFCGHHFNKGEAKIRETAVSIVDERYKINAKPSQSSV